jgi:hypothetical protein
MVVLVEMAGGSRAGISSMIREDKSGSPQTCNNARVIYIQPPVQ